MWFAQWVLHHYILVSGGVTKGGGLDPYSEAICASGDGSVRVEGKSQCKSVCKIMNHRLHINQISTHLNMSPFLPPSSLFFDWLHPSDVQRHTGVAQGKSSGAVGNCVNCSILFLHKKGMNETVVYCISAKCLINKLKGPDLWWWELHPLLWPI